VPQRGPKSRRSCSGPLHTAGHRASLGAACRQASSAPTPDPSARACFQVADEGRGAGQRAAARRQPHPPSQLASHLPPRQHQDQGPPGPPRQARPAAPQRWRSAASHASGQRRRHLPIAEGACSGALNGTWRTGAAHLGNGQPLPKSACIGPHPQPFASHFPRSSRAWNRLLEPNPASRTLDLTTPHTREVAGSKPAAPIVAQRRCQAGSRTRSLPLEQPASALVEAFGSERDAPPPPATFPR